MRPSLRVNRRDETGATLVEFALVAPLVFLLIFGLIGGSYLAFQNASLHDGATAGARMASIETSLVTQDAPNQYCESGSPTSIEQAVKGAAPLVKVNPAPLCATSATPTELTQGQTVDGDVNITVICGGTCDAPTSTTVTLTFDAKGIAAPFGLTYHMTATSQDPVLSP
ncbi:MAG TPA: TadE/TadG family type IV pilus assembly protein [Acidimicrobiales bacterium]|nr:TadE/TadG family type IV pilus assembly protein [Acidimicrobiales bacterium]